MSFEAAEKVDQNAEAAEFLPLMSEEEDCLIDGIGVDKRKRFSEEQLVARATLESTPRDASLYRRWVAVVTMLAAFLAGAMSAAIVPVTVDFLEYQETSMDDLAYGVVFAFSPIWSLIFAVPAIWFGGFDQKSGGLSMLLMAFILWAGSALLSACASLVSSGRRFAALLLARCVCGAATVFSSTSVISLLAVACNDTAQCRALSLMALGCFQAGEIFSLFLSGVTSIAGVVAGWQIAFCILAALAAVGVVTVAFARHQLQAYTFATQASLPSIDTIRSVVTSPLLLLLTINYVLVVMTSTFSTVLGPLWMRKTFSPGPPSWTIALVFLTRPIVFLGVLMLKRVERTRTLLQWRAMALTTLVLTSSCVCWIILSSVRIPHVSIAALPLSVVGGCVAIIEVNTFPVLSHILGDCCDAQYGGLQFMHIVASQMALSIGPILSTALLSQVGVAWSFYAIAVVLAFYVPFLGILKSFEDHVQTFHPGSETSSIT